MLSLSPTQDGVTRVWIGGVCIDALTETRLVDQVIASLTVGRGGWIATPNIHFLRRAVEDPDANLLLTSPTLRVPDGMPLIWASQLARTGRLHRITGSSLIYTLSEAAAHHKKSIYILGGPEGAAELAGQRLQELYPGLKVVGAEGPWLSSAVTDDELEPLIQRLEDAAPDIVFCGFGFPKQEKVVAACRARLPNAWFLGCGAAVNFAAGYERRAPLWMQRTGLEWAHRLISEPRRLFRRYVFDAIFAARLLVTSAWVGAVGVRSVGIPSETIVLPDVAAARTQLTETTVDAVAIEPPGAVVAFAMAEHI